MEALFDVVVCVGSAAIEDTVEPVSAGGRAAVRVEYAGSEK